MSTSIARETTLIKLAQLSEDVLKTNFVRMLASSSPNLSVAFQIQVETIFILWSLT